MKVNETGLPGVLLIEPKVFGDTRGFFFESWNARVFREATGLNCEFVQDNHSRSAKGVLRGLHFQLVHPQGKLVRVSQGRVWDVAVDVRKSSPNFGQHVAFELSDSNQYQLWIPPGFAHGFLVLSDYADFQYKTTDYWIPEHERSLNWNDPSLRIKWPRLERSYQLAGKDRDAPLLGELDAAGDLYG